MYLLPAGLHRITGLLSRSAVDDTGAPLDTTVGAIRVVTPEPAAWVMLATGLLLSGLAYRRTH